MIEFVIALTVLIVCLIVAIPWLPLTILEEGGGSDLILCSLMLAGSACMVFGILNNMLVLFISGLLLAGIVMVVDK